MDPPTNHKLPTYSTQNIKVLTCESYLQIEIREDYSHLAPEQQHRKLQHKVDQLEALLNKTHQDK